MDHEQDRQLPASFTGKARTAAWHDGNVSQRREDWRQNFI
jgi:hypothetical protein